MFNKDPSEFDDKSKKQTEKGIPARLPNLKKEDEKESQGTDRTLAKLSARARKLRQRRLDQIGRAHV